jgi:DNA-binding NtrC family response regulator
LWAATLVLAVASLLFGYLELDGLPDLGVQFGPDLTVRSVSVDRDSGAEHQEFKRGDRLVAVQGQSVEDLRDLRTVLQNLPPDSEGEGSAQPPVAATDSSEQSEADEAPTESTRTATYQLVRPLHRFHITLQGELQDPTGLPQGVEPTDRLIKLDGRELQTKVGPEAVRSIIASRPQSVLFFERQNAVFSGTMQVPDAEPPYGVVGAFGLVILVLLALWFFRSRDLEPGSVIAISLQTVCIGWIALLAFQYQWTISVYGLTAAVIAGFALVRPFSFFARNIGAGYGTQSGWVALVVGLFATGSVFGLLFGGYFESAEQALHVAALIACLFVVYEVFLASIDEGGPTSTLGEGTGYLAWILVLALFAALFAWYLAPISFEENRWRWFAAVIVGLVWFGDVLHCFRGPGTSGYQAIAHKADREFVILDYLEHVRALVPQVRPLFVVRTPQESMLLEERGGTLRISSTSDALHDAVSILVQEGVRIPLPETINRRAHPMGGIATTMKMGLALRMGAPEGGVHVDELDLVLVGIEASSKSDLPVHPSNETLDELRHLLTSEVWTAALFEGLAHLGPVGEAAPRRRELSTVDPADAVEMEAGAMEAGEARAKQLEAELEELRSQLRAATETDEENREETNAGHGPQEKSSEETSSGGPTATEADHEQVSSESGEENEPASQVDPEVSVLAEPPSHFDELVEPELVEALHYLLDSSEPLVLGGAPGAGKTFTARCAHAIESGGDVELLAYDASRHSQDEQLDVLFGDVQADDAAPGLLERSRGRALLIQSAEHLSDALILRLCQANENGEFRLYLAFDDSEAETRSVLDDRSKEVRELLEHRELIVPGLAHRPTILEAILEHFLEEYSKRAGSGAHAGLSDDALVALRHYCFPGEVAEARTIIEDAVAQAGDDQIQASHLAVEIDASDADIE